MRKYAVALLAVPIVFPILLGAILRRSLLARTGLAVGVGAVIAFGAIALARPASTAAVPPSTTLPLTQAAFQMRVDTDVEADAAVSIAFSAPMDRASVESSITVEPAAAVSYSWSEDDTKLAVAPTDHWALATYYTITVQPGALARSGRPSTSPARAAFLTRSASAAHISAMQKIGSRVSVGSGFVIGFDRPVDVASLTTAVRLEPSVALEIRLRDEMDGAPTYLVIPRAPLAPDTVYRLVVNGAREAHGAPIIATSLDIRTISSPRVVRFRPLAKASDVARDVAISVRFTAAMDHASTRKAFSVTAAGKAVAGTVRFAEGGTVLIFAPKTALPFGAKIVASVAAGAKSAGGIPIAAAATATFQTVAKPATKAAAKPVPIPRPSGGGSVGAGSWGAVERYYLKLMNCTRTGGWVTSTGSCSSPGGRNVAPLFISAAISDKVSRPYAKLLATRNICNHFINGTPGDRLRRAGFRSYKWAENLGCRSGNAYSAVLGSHLYFQSERSYNGGHYVNLMNAMYDRVGLGVWVSSGRMRLVVDFYHP